MFLEEKTNMRTKNRCTVKKTQKQDITSYIWYKFNLIINKSSIRDQVVDMEFNFYLEVALIYVILKTDPENAWWMEQDIMAISYNSIIKTKKTL